MRNTLTSSTKDSTDRALEALHLVTEERTVQKLLLLRFRTCRITPQLSKTSLSPSNPTIAKWTYLKWTISTILGNDSLQKYKSLPVNSSGQISLQSTKTCCGCLLNYRNLWRTLERTLPCWSYPQEKWTFRDQCPLSFTQFHILRVPHYSSQSQMWGAQRKELKETFAISHHNCQKARMCNFSSLITWEQIFKKQDKVSDAMSYSVSSSAASAVYRNYLQGL